MELSLASCVFLYITFRLCNTDCISKEDNAVRRGFSLIGSAVDDQIFEIIIFIFLLHIPAARYLNHSRTENLYLLLCADNSVLFTSPQKLLN